MIGNIEQAIEDCIKTAVKSGKLGYSIDRIAGYKGEFENIRELLGNCRSAVLIAFGGKTLKRKFDFAREYEATFLIEVYSRTSTRNEKSARFGNGNDAGAYQMAEDVETLLEDNNLNLLSEPLVLQKTTPVFNTGLPGFHTAAFELEFTCAYQTGGADDDKLESLGRFETLAVNWDTPENADLTIHLPQTEES